MKEVYKKDLGGIILEFCINGVSTPSDPRSWVDVDINITSTVISYNLKDWERDGEIFMRDEMPNVISLMDRWLQNKLISVEEYETFEPDLLLKFYPGKEKRIDFCICLQTDELAFAENYIVLPLLGENAIDFVEYWKTMTAKL